MKPLVMHGKHQHLKVGISLRKRFDQIAAAAVLERQVHNRKVRGKPIHSFDRRWRILGLAAENQVFLLIDQLRKPLSQQGMIVGTPAHMAPGFWLDNGLVYGGF